MQTPRQLFTGGPVFTSDPEQPWAQAVVVEDGLIAFVGSADEARINAGPGATVVDVSGGIVLPGFVDAHAHLMMTGDSLLKAQLRRAGDIGAIRELLQEWAAANPLAPRILGMGWLYSALPGGLPNKQLLDDLFADRPVYLEANDFHATWVNSAALDELGITNDTPDPIGGRIVRDEATGEATGHLLENASVTMVWPLLARVDDATRDGYVAAAITAYNEAGVTTAVDMALDRHMLASMARLAEGDELTVRIIGHVLIHRSGDTADELQQVVAASGLASEYASDVLRVTGIKIIVDGTIDGCTAAMINPYANGTTADAIWDLEALVPVVTAADAAGLQVALHAIGDQAVRTAIDAIEAATATNGTSGRRHRIEHLEYVDEADVVRLAALGITASMQPVHVDPATLSNWLDMLGDARADRGFAWQEFLAAGTTLAFGTDTPTAPHLPLHNMYIAATRRSPSDPTLAPHRPDFVVALPEAIVHGTRDAAWASFAEDRIGMLRAGLAADLIVLDGNPFVSGDASLLDIGIVLTMAGGRIVHPRSQR